MVILQIIKKAGIGDKTEAEKYLQQAIANGVQNTDQITDKVYRLIAEFNK
jgi:hypothetical protein